MLSTISESGAHREESGPTNTAPSSHAGGKLLYSVDADSSGMDMT
jgi:hypothetical protein